MSARNGMPGFAAVLVLVASGCASGGVPAQTVASIPPDAPRVVAQGDAFVLGSVHVMAGVPFDLVLDNRDSDPHNVTILANQAGADPRFVGEVFSGPTVRLYRVPGLAIGTYQFRCDVHPSMTGTIAVG